MTEYNFGNDEKTKTIAKMIDRNTSVDIMKSIISTQIDLDLNGLVITACEKGNYQLMILFLDKGGSPNAQSAIGSTPLMFAAQQGRVDVVKYLLEKGANLFIKNRQGKYAYNYDESREVCSYLDNYLLNLQKSASQPKQSTVDLENKVINLNKQVSDLLKQITVLVNQQEDTDNIKNKLKKQLEESGKKQAELEKKLEELQILFDIQHKKIVDLTCEKTLKV